MVTENSCLYLNLLLDTAVSPDDLPPKNATYVILIPPESPRRPRSDDATLITCTGYLQITPPKSLWRHLLWAKFAVK